MKNRTALIALTVLGLSFAGCSKPAPDAASATPKVQDLGVLEVSDGVESRHDLAGGRVCSITPTFQKDGTILLSMSIKEAGKLLAAPMLMTKADSPVTISVGDIGFGLTPHIKK